MPDSSPDASAASLPSQSANRCRLSGLHALNAASIREDLLRLLDTPDGDPVIEFASEGRIDSSGLAVLLAFFATAARERPGRRVVVEGVSPMLRRLLAMVRAQDFDLDLVIRDQEDPA